MACEQFKPTVEELTNILALHKKWWRNGDGGKRADLRQANLYRADLRGAYLRRAYLQGADLRGADLRRVSLRSAELNGADLRGADLRGADLRGADLQGAYLQGAYLRGADLQLIGERPVLQISPIGSRDDVLLVYITNQGLLFQAGCFFGNEEQFIASIAETHRELLTALDRLQSGPLGMVSLPHSTPSAGFSTHRLRALRHLPDADF